MTTKKSICEVETRLQLRISTKKQRSSHNNSVATTTTTSIHTPLSNLAVKTASIRTSQSNGERVQTTVLQAA